MAAVADGPLARVLAAHRERLNARFAAARATHPQLDGDLLLAHLARHIDPIVQRVAEEFAEKVEPVTIGLFDLSLELMACDLLGPRARFPIFERIWTQLLPAIPRLLARSSQRVAGSIFNAAHHLASTQGADAERWLARLAALAGDCTTSAELLDAGAVLAWRCGMVPYRAGALEKAARLPAPLACATLDLPVETTLQDFQRILARLAEDPWIAPADILAGTPSQLRLVHRTGGFRGLAGPFLTPPQVWAADGDLFAADTDGTWRIHADLYNAMLLRVDGQPPARPASASVLGRDGSITWHDRSGQFPWLAQAASSAASEHTLAMTLSDSHYVFLLAAAAGGKPAC